MPDTSPTHGTAKPASYYAQARAELVSALPRPLGRVLDVGCAAGGAAGPLRAGGALELVGVELDVEAASMARGSYEHVHVGSIETIVDELEPPFDTVLCYDVLEHLVDPWRVVARLLDLSSPGGRIHVSVPNARSISLLRDLVLRGTFGYAEWGHRDVTHLRWFTRRDLVTMLAGAGWVDVAVSHGQRRAASLALDRVTGGLVGEFAVGQWYALARAPSAD